MKVRIGFVSNSSSCSFVIDNQTKKKKTLVNFVEENPQLIEDFRRIYDWYKEEGVYEEEKGDLHYTQEGLLESARRADEVLEPGPNRMEFGDGDGDLIGLVFDYILREGGSSKSFKWFLLKVNR
jgi:hypothetical protein